MTLDIEFEVPTWIQIYEMLSSLAAKIRGDNFSPDIIVGVCRGGWPPAKIISSLLGNVNLAKVTVEFYSGVAKSNKEPVLTQPISIPVTGMSVLIIDDVADTGKTLNLVKKHLSKKRASSVRIATIYLKPWSTVTPNYYKKETDHWIVFPWERREAFRNLIEDFRVEEVKKRLVEDGMDKDLVKSFIEEILDEDSK